MLTTAQPTFVGLELDEDRWWNVYSDGTRLPLIAGGADDDEPDDDEPDDDKSDDDEPDDDKSDDDEPDDDEPLGPKGTKALAAEKQRRKDEAERRRKAEARTRELEAQLAKAGKKGDDDKDEPDAEAIREEARREAKAEALRERSLDRIEARAGRTFEIKVDGKPTKVRFGDPEDAIAFLKEKAADFIDGDTIDSEAIDEALVELLEKKPRLAEVVRGKRKFDGDADGGARKSDKKKPASLGDAIEKRLAGTTKR